MIVGVVKESFSGERRVALTPDVVPILAKSDIEVLAVAGRDSHPVDGRQWAR